MTLDIKWNFTKFFRYSSSKAAAVLMHGCYCKNNIRAKLIAMFNEKGRVKSLKLVCFQIQNF